MDDKCIMENLLLTTKGVCDLYMHGAIESSTATVQQAFSSAFDDALSMGDTIYQQMSAKKRQAGKSSTVSAGMMLRAGKIGQNLQNKARRIRRIIFPSRLAT